ncbi:MAG: HEAT repeat domain-containing protein [Planctomycetes bacterium]|nr:HEAT repeat domain-containing protein [Planctomycetota bacterium]
MTCNFSNEHRSDRASEHRSDRASEHSSDREHPLERDKLLGYLDNEIDTKQRAEIGLHLKGCPECRDELESLKEAQTLWRRTLGPHALAPDFYIRVKNRVSRTVFRRWALRFAVAGAAAVWMLAVTLVFLSPSKDNPVPQDSTASVGTGGNEMATRTDKQPIGLEQPITATSITDSIAMQTEKDHFKILHHKQPMLSILVKMLKKQVSKGDNADVKESTAIATAELIKLLSDKDDEIRGIAAATLGELKATESIPELVKLLNDKYAGARGWAAIALTELGAQDKVSQNAIADIKLIRDNSDEAYGARAQAALEKLGIADHHK